MAYNAEAARRLPGKQFISLLLQFFRNQLFFYTFILANVAQPERPTGSGACSLCCAPQKHHYTFINFKPWTAKSLQQVSDSITSLLFVFRFFPLSFYLLILFLFCLYLLSFFLFLSLSFLSFFSFTFKIKKEMNAKHYY